MGMSTKGIHCTELVFIIFLHSGVVSLKITSFTVPARVDPRYDEPEMSCQYEFGPEGLFTVKWYKDDREFYRYLPTYDPQIIQFPTDEVTLSEKGFIETKTTLEKRNASREICNTTACTIKLVNLTEASSGEYSCEISSERPYFNTDMKSANLSVVALPTDPPSIEGMATSYSSGDIFQAICITQPSLPSAVISWLINGEGAPRNTIRNIFESSSSDKFGLKTSRSELHFRVEDGHFRGDHSQLNITCAASIPNTDVVKSSHLTFALVGYQRMTLENQKLEWNSSGGKGSESFNSTLFTMMALLIILKNH